MVRFGFQRFFACVTALLLTACLLMTSLCAAEEVPAEAASEAMPVEISDTLTYKEFLKKREITTEYTSPDGAANGAELDSAALAEGKGNFTSDGESIFVEEENSVTVSFAAVPGLYNLVIEYDPVYGRSRNIEMAVRVNGELQHQEAGKLILPRKWRDVDGIIETDSNNNDIRPSQEEIPFEERGWLKYTASDSSGFYTRPLLFEIKETNTITLFLSREGLRIHSIAFVPAEKVPLYKEYAAAHSGVPDAEQSLPVIEAELPAWKTESTAVAFADRKSPMSTPNKGSKVCLNIIGGSYWTTPDSEIAWEFTPGKTGMYEIRFRARQNYNRGFYTTRTLKIDGETPFAEAANVRFTYDSSWQICIVSADGAPCKFYFEQGKTYTLSLSNTLGDFSEALGRVEQSISALNGIYREFLMIMSSSPDIRRDYELEKQIPETIEEMLVQAAELEDIANNIEEISGAAGGELAALRKAAQQLREFHKDTSEVAKQIRYFKDNIASLNTWMLDAKALPVDIDTVTIAAPGAVVPRADANIIELAGYVLQSFFASFVEDYNTLGGGGKTDEELLVWSTAGRDQANIINDLIRSSYMPGTQNTLGKSVGVKLQIVQPDAILPSVAAGNGPDVLMNAAINMPVNYATRGAAVDLMALADDAEMAEVQGRFRESALTPFRFDGGLYALPEQETYSLMFYRSDILAELGITAPTLEKPWTWEDIIRILPVLQKKNLEFLMETGTNVGADMSLGMHTYAMFLYQNGGRFYDEDGRTSVLDSEPAAEAFKYWTKFYSSYGMPTVFNIANRFRTGEAPIVITDLTLFNQLVVSAPEISGLWQICMVPGTVREDGTTDHSVRSVTSGIMMMTTTQARDAAWDFMKWWTSADAQVSFSREMESLLGASARYPTANIEAMAQLPWSARDYRVLQAQAEWARGVPEVPGGYFTPRHINNAFRAVVVKSDGIGDEPRDVLLKYTRIINEEIVEKRREFGLPLSD